jgi:hypothetical protein
MTMVGRNDGVSGGCPVNRESVGGSVHVRCAVARWLTARLVELIERDGLSVAAAARTMGIDVPAAGLLVRLCAIEREATETELEDRLDRIQELCPGETGSPTRPGSWTRSRAASRSRTGSCASSRCNGASGTAARSPSCQGRWGWTTRGCDAHSGSRQCRHGATAGRTGRRPSPSSAPRRSSGHSGSRRARYPACESHPPARNADVHAIHGTAGTHQARVTIHGHRAPGTAARETNRASAPASVLAGSTRGDIGSALRSRWSPRANAHTAADGDPPAWRSAGGRERWLPPPRTAGQIRTGSR